MRPATILAFVALAAPLDVVACSWEGISQANVAQVLETRIQDADAVLDAIVKSVRSEGTDEVAEVLVVTGFKGSGKGSTFTLRGHLQPCGYRFEVGERRIY